MSSASLVEGLRVERIRFPLVVCREPNVCGIDVMAVAREAPGKSARVLVVGLEGVYKPCHVQWSGRP